MWACRFSGEEVQLPRIQLPYLYLVLDGALRLHTPSGILDYGAGQYSISRIDTPLRGTVLAPSREEDLLALALAFTANQVIEVVLSLDRELTERIAGEGLGEGTAAAADRAVLQTADRLLAARDQPLPPPFCRTTSCGSCSTTCSAAAAAGSFSRALRRSGRRRRSTGPTAGSRSTSAAALPWRLWRSSGT